MVSLSRVPPAIASTADQWLYTRDELAVSPSIEAGMHPDQELYNRVKAVHKLKGLYDMLHSKAIVFGTAAIFMHRFYMRKPMQEFEPEPLAAAAFFLAAKVAESTTTLRKVVNALLELQRDEPRPNPPTLDDKSPVYIKTRAMILYYEDALLKALCFDLTINHSFGLMLAGLKRIYERGKGEELKRRRKEGKEIAKVAWPILIDSLATPACLLYKANIIAAAGVVAACQQLGRPLPSMYPSESNGDPDVTMRDVEDEPEEGEEKEETKDEEPRPWLQIFEDADPDEVKACVEYILDAYKTASDPFVRTEAKAVRFPSTAL